MNAVGNHIKSLVKTYANEIAKLESSVVSEQELHCVELVLSALPLSLFGNLYGSFSDRDTGKVLLRSFFSEFEYLILSDEFSDLLTTMMHEALQSVLTDKDRGFVLMYEKTMSKSLTLEERTWVKNYTSAIFQIYRNYSDAAAVKGKFAASIK